MSKWEIIEIRERVDQFGHLHRVLKDSAGWILEIFRGDTDERCLHSFRFDTLDDALVESAQWEARRVEEKAAADAEAAKWPKVTTKEIRRVAWIADETETVDFQELQPEGDRRTIKIFNRGGTYLGSIQSRFESSVPRNQGWVTKAAGEDRYEPSIFRYKSQAEAVRSLLNTHERKNR